MPKTVLRNLLLFLLTAVVFSYGGYTLGRGGWEAEVRKSPPKIEIVNKTPRDQTVDFSLFWQVFDLLNQRYLNRPLKAQELLYGAVRGLTAAVGDPYTAFLNPEQNALLQDSLNGEYEGVGAELGMREGQLVVIAPLDGSPAKAAGVRAGDKILRIENEETAGVTLTEAVTKIRGKAGTVSTLTLGRGDADKPFEVKITRARIAVPSVSWEKKSAAATGSEAVYYLRLSRFGENTNSEWEKMVREIVVDDTKAPRVVVLDLRSNPGGFLDSAVFVASEFIEEGLIVSEEFGDGARRDFTVNRRGALLGTKVVVLLNEGSASASEIVAAALKHYRGAIFVGKDSFGKGTVQEARDLPGGAGVHITVARWLTPKGESLEGHGLKVDEKVDLTEEDINNDQDPQLKKAQEIAKGMGR